MRALVGIVVAGVAALPGAASGQVEAAPVLEGTAFVGDAPVEDGIIVLHHLQGGEPLPTDTVRTGEDGRFQFRLGNVPDALRDDVFFASLRHDGVLYFGSMITEAVQLESPYEIHAYDTLVAPPEGVEMGIVSRSIFFDPDDGGGWRATDIFELNSERDRTVVAQGDGRTWSYPLPPGATDVLAGDGDFSFDQASHEDGDLVIRAALPPGERIFVIRYRLASPFVTIPTPTPIGQMDVLISEPAPLVDVPGFDGVPPVPMEDGTTYRRFAVRDHVAPDVAILEGEESQPIPVEWVSVILALLLTVGGLVALRGRAGGEARAPATAAVGRDVVLMRIAKLDEEFAARADPTEAQRRRYDRRRAQLLEQARASH